LIDVVKSIQKFFATLEMSTTKLTIHLQGRRVRYSRLVYPKKVRPTMPTRDFVSDVILATVKSWSFPYRGHVAEVLYDYQRGHNIPHAYTRLIPIVNSSGTGKSRTIDEFSKDHFVIPFNLRAGNQGDFFVLFFGDYVSDCSYEADRISRA
jgi:hypothetical protein